MCTNSTTQFVLDQPLVVGNERELRSNTSGSSKSRLVAIDADPLPNNDTEVSPGREIVMVEVCQSNITATRAVDYNYTVWDCRNVTHNASDGARPAPRVLNNSFAEQITSRTEYRSPVLLDFTRPRQYFQDTWNLLLVLSFAPVMLAVICSSFTGCALLVVQKRYPNTENIVLGSA
eukprot:NODE_151_length_2362_cov_49.997838_g131_i0.p3 GENE.NODE_151_length_2362_cov_49.997838_g131_i0~~NODE_151_length_2362_cov_49.997838_g131_i0.p3  ORF type:complete len:176 (-),score=32.64 NODE_151_length_2362_cov_49.997838_g131_i0:89-616(-)